MQPVASTAAVANAVVRGARQYREIAIVTEGSKAVAPCGACRQVLRELAPHLRVVSQAAGERREWDLADLLPDAFEGSFVRSLSRGTGTKAE